MGRVVDPETGLIYLRGRYYDPGTAQFLSRDPAVAITQSAYGYGHGNPLNRVDPSGLDDSPGCNPGNPYCYSPDNPGAGTNGAGYQAPGPGCDHFDPFGAAGGWIERNLGTANGIANLGAGIATWANRAGVVLDVGAGACALAGTPTTGVGGVICGFGLLGLAGGAGLVSAGGSALEILGGIAGGNQQGVVQGSTSLLADGIGFMVSGPFEPITSTATRSVAGAIVGGVNELISDFG